MWDEVESNPRYRTARGKVHFLIMEPELKEVELGNAAAEWANWLIASRTAWKVELHPPKQTQYSKSLPR